VDVRFEMEGKAFVAIDTAGLRKKKSFQDRIEWFALDRAKRAVERADVVLLLVDATEAVSQVDQQLAMIAQKSYKPVLIVVNKWDLAEGRPAKGLGPKHRGQAVTPEMYEEYLRKEFKGLPFAPLAFVSAREGMNLKGAVHVAFDLHRQATKRVSTGKLNRLLKDILATRGPSSKLGTFAKAYFIAQVAVDPPTIALVVNKPELFTPNYKRFLLNRIRENVPYPEVPIKLLVKGRTRAKPEDLVEGERQRLREEGAAVVTEEGRVEARRRAAPRPLGADEDFSDAAGLPAGARAMEDLDDLPDDAEAYFDDEEADGAAPEGGAAGDADDEGADEAELDDDEAEEDQE
jgi:GTP-binding protein